MCLYISWPVSTDDSQMSEDGTSEDELAVADAGGASDESLELDGNDEGAGRESDQSSSDGNDPGN